MTERSLTIGIFIVLVALILTVLLALSACGDGIVAVVAAPTPGFTSGSAVVELDDKTWYIGVEAVIPQTPPLASYDLPFNLPPNGKVIRLEGTTAFRSSCQNAQYLAIVMVDGKKYAMNEKIRFGGGATSLFVKYAVPLNYSFGHANVHVEAVANCPGGPTTWEFQGLLQLE